MPTHTAADESQIIEVVHQAREWKAPLEIVAGGTKRNLGRPVVTMGSALDVSGLSGIVSYQPEELILTVKPATPVAQIKAILAQKGQRLGFDPPEWAALLGADDGAGTIGGAISCDAAGPGRILCGGARDHLLGISGINGLGERFKAGGKVVKNVTGFDIPKLVCGAMGTICVLSELTLRVFPKPPRTASFAVRGLSPEDGFSVLRKVWSSPLAASGLCFSKDSAFVRLEGDDEILTAKTRILCDLAPDHEFRNVEDGEIAFAAIGDGSVFLDTPFDVWRVFVPPAQASRAVAVIDSPLWLADWAGGLLWMASLPGSDDVRRSAQECGGYAILMRADDMTRERIAPFEPLDEAHAALTRAVKAAFDPMGLFNPDRMWEGI